jgi:ABC-type lipoprotein export system ATPase subunit
MGEAIRLENVVKMYRDGVRALNGVSIRILQGEHVRVCGLAGSGKTTLTRLIAGMDRPSAGQVFVLGEPVHIMTPDAAADFRNQNIGILQRNPAFLEKLTLLENVSLPLALRSEAAATCEKKGREILKTLGLLYAAHAFPVQLSVLERHQAAIARALITQPRILLLDDFLADIYPTEELKGNLNARCTYADYTVVELTGANQGLIIPDKTIQLDHGHIQEELP